MRYSLGALALLAAATLPPPPDAGSSPPQAFDWQTATAESQGMSTPALDTLKNRLAPTSK